MDKLLAIVKVAGLKDYLKKIINKPKLEIKTQPPPKGDIFNKKVVSTKPSSINDWNDLKELRKRLENGPDIEI